MKQKKIFAALLAGALVLSLTACQSGGETSVPPEGNAPAGVAVQLSLIHI